MQPAVDHCLFSSCRGLSPRRQLRRLPNPNTGWFYHTHTGERLDIVYRRGSTYIPEAIAALERHLRDHRTGDVHPFDPRLFDSLFDLTRTVGHPGVEIDVICGYRTSWSNMFLRRHSSGVAEHSLHLQAMATLALA